jgi:ATP-dependent RNA helicase DeaD
MQEFQILGLTQNTLDILKNKGFSKPTKIQKLTIPLILKNKQDIIGQAQTGTGKTASFGLPILEILKENTGQVQTLILVPTRDLALQVQSDLISFKGQKRVSIRAIYGGQPIERQIKELRTGSDIVVGTPGRILDHLNRRTLQLQNVSHLVLDEADEMLNMGFLKDVERIMLHTPKNKRTLLFSATMPKAIMKIIDKHMKSYEICKVAETTLATANTLQLYVEVPRDQKIKALTRILDLEKSFYGIVFCRTRFEVKKVAADLKKKGHSVSPFSGDISQRTREKIMQQFKSQKLSVLVATDVAARGIDVKNLTHVINYTLPDDSNIYVHRIGRTGRAGQQGTAISFVGAGEFKKIKDIEHISKISIEKFQTDLGVTLPHGFRQEIPTAPKGRGNFGRFSKKKTSHSSSPQESYKKRWSPTRKKTTHK